MKRIICTLLLAGILALSGCQTKRDAKGSIEYLQSMAESSYLPQVTGEWFEDSFANNSDFVAGATRMTNNGVNYLAISLFPTQPFIQGLSSDGGSMQALAISIAGPGLIVYYECDMPAETIYCDGKEYSVSSGGISTDTLTALNDITIQRQNSKLDMIDIPPSNPLVQIEEGAGQYYDVILE